MSDSSDYRGLAYQTIDIATRPTFVQTAPHEHNVGMDGFFSDAEVISKGPLQMS